MVILRLTLDILGTFEINEDYSVSAISLLPNATPNELTNFAFVVKQKANEFITPLQAVIAAISTIYLVGPDSLTVHFEKKITPRFEPE